jgi:hypothetical protein
MFDFIPLEYYSKLFYYVTLLMVLISFFALQINNKHSNSTTFNLVLMVGLIIYIGFRPISGGMFGDMRTYANIFEAYVKGYEGTFDQDIGFDWFMQKTAQLINIELFFLLVAFIYVFAHFWASKRFFSNYWHYAFLIFIASFSFWSYGTNGLRNGLAAALVVLAFSFERKKIIAIVLALVAVSFHKSMLLPVIAYFLTFVNNNSKYYVIFWVLCIPISLAAGGAFELFFAGLGFDDQRLVYLTDGNVNDDEFSSTGFRWDFLLYSTTAVASGFYFVILKQFKDVLYQRLFNVYLLSNAFWILVIRANFSNRFAYLSWFIMGLVIIYPFLKGTFIKNQPKVLGWVLLVYFLFTFMLNVVLAKA